MAGRLCAVRSKMLEQWRAVPGYEGAYEVSDLGRVRSLDREIVQLSRRGTSYASYRKGRVLRPGRMSGGHQSVVLTREGGSRCVHELVALAFIGSRPDGYVTRHLNGDPTDNRAVNLAWSTQGDNGRDKKWHSGCATYKLSPDDIRRIKIAQQLGIAGVDIARQFNISPSVVSKIKLEQLHSDVTLCVL